MFIFPWSNLHELNLDWILMQVKKFSELIAPMSKAVDDIENLKEDVEQAVEDAATAKSDSEDAVETAEEAKEIAQQAAQGAIADGAVITSKIADGAVTYAKLNSGLKNSIDDVALLKQHVLFPTGDARDRSAEIQEKLNTYGCCELEAGDYYIGATIEFPHRSRLTGCGKRTKLMATTGVTNLTFLHIPTGVYNVTISDLAIYGSNASLPATENIGLGERGIFCEGDSARVTIENCLFYGLTKSGIYFNSGYSTLSSVNVSNCSFLYCNYGFNAGLHGEFATVVNSNFNSCYYGAIVIGGNNKFANCGFDGNRTGFVLYDDASNPSNDGHGSCVSSSFNHNTVSAIEITNIDNGFIFDSCCVYFGDITITNSKGIMFVDSLIQGQKSTTEHSNFILNNNSVGLITIKNCVSHFGFVITKNGSNPNVIATGNKEFDGDIITPSNKYRQGGFIIGETADVNSYSDTFITFPQEFPAAPYVQFTPVSDPASVTIENAKVQFYATSITTTGFTIRTFNASSIIRSFGFEWLAYFNE